MAYWEKTGWDYGRPPPEREEGAVEPGPYYPEYQVGGQEVHPAREYEYSHFERDVASPQREAYWDWPDRPGLGPQRRWSVARRAPFQRPAYKWGVEQSPSGWRRISREYPVGPPPETWTRPESMNLTTGGRGGYYGYGPKGYVRTDQRIREDVCDRLMGYDRLDCSDIEVTAENGEVTLSGTVASRWAKHVAEDIAADVLGVKDVHNRLRVQSPQNSR
jgi:hypothetical protein